ncbi:MAG: glycosyl transferase family protein [Microgenomates group bacterium Gr01-1014_7]|nr:MAG: glycosyl transferase family protein [Microgenomates group bacterium Gr01-1014_7]
MVYKNILVGLKGRMKNRSNNPLASVIMPAYNAVKYVEQATESILNQTYKKFEFIIIDDASTDSTLNILKDFRKKDKRIILIQNKKNLGVTKNLNKALELVKGKYIIRMDADDWSYPERFQLQIDLMEKNPNVVVSGSYVEVCDSKLKTKYIRKYHHDDTNIRKHIFRYSPFAHPATIWQAKVLKKERYNESLTTCQDYELYFRVGKIGKFMNLDKSLLKLRIHENSVSVVKNDLQWKNTVLIRFNAVLILGYNMSKFDKVYSFLQELCIALLPVKLRFILFNFIRRLNLY